MMFFSSLDGRSVFTDARKSYLATVHQLPLLWRDIDPKTISSGPKIDDCPKTRWKRVLVLLFTHYFFLSLLPGHKP